MPVPNSMQDYLRMFAGELGERILQSFPALHNAHDPVSPRLATLLRKPFPAQTVAAMGVAKKWETDRSAAVIAECGTGKTLISLAALHVHSDGRPFTAIVMAPGHITLKWCKEALETIPRLRVFLIDGLRDRVRDGSTPSGVNEVKLRRGQIVREGLHTTLTDLRLRKNHKSARARWQQEICSGPAIFVVGRDKGKLSHFWRHAYQVARSGRYLGSVVNPDTGVRVEMGERWLIASDFRKARLSEVIGGAGEREEGADLKPRRPIYSPLWQADGKRIRRVAPLDFIGRFMPGWFDYAICDEAHQLANDTAQGNGLGTLAACADRTVILTGTLLGGYASDVYNLLYRLEAGKMAAHGYEWGEPGLRSFAETYGVLERVTTIEPADNSCSKARVTKQIKRRPGASPLLFSEFLMSLAAFVSLRGHFGGTAAVHRTSHRCAHGRTAPGCIPGAGGADQGSHQRAPLEPFGDQRRIERSASLSGSPLEHRRPLWLRIRPRNAAPGTIPDCPTRRTWIRGSCTPRKDAWLRLVKAELQMGRRCCHVYAVYTRKRDVTRRLETILAREGIRVAVLTSDVPPEKRETWFAQRVREGVQVTISHPKIIETGIDLLNHSSLIFFESGYSLHTLRQASRRSWRIGQRQPVRVFYLHYEETMQSSCLRLMGRKLLVSLAMEGKFSREGLQSLNEDDDMLTAMARELVTENGVGESAAAVWRQIQAENSKLFNAGIITTDSEPVVPSAFTTSLVAPPLTNETISGALKFGMRPPLVRPPVRKREAVPMDLQVPLF